MVVLFSLLMWIGFELQVERIARFAGNALGGVALIDRHFQIAVAVNEEAISAFWRFAVATYPEVHDYIA